MVHTEGENNRIEIWKDYKNYEGLYQASNLGRMRSLDRWVSSKNGSMRFIKGRILKPVTGSNDYLKVNLYKNNKQKTYLVHRIIAEAFIEIPEELKQYIGTAYLQVNHKDENKQNNNVSNLEWCNSKYNCNFGTRNERVIAKNTNGKLSKPVLQYTLDGVFVREWESAKQAEREDGYQHGHIISVCGGKRNNHKGFIWKYK